MMIFEPDDRVALNPEGVAAFSNANGGVNWFWRRGFVERGNPRGGGAVMVCWDGCAGSVPVPTEYLRKISHSHRGLGALK